MKKLIIIGARALGRKVCNYARDAGFCVVGFLDSKQDSLADFEGYPPVLGNVEDWSVSVDDRFVCAVGDSKMRAKYASIIESKGGVFETIIHPTAYVGSNVRIGDGCIVCPFAIIDCDLTMGRHVIANVHTLVAHDCVLEDYVTLSPNVHLGGRTRLGREVFLGIGSTTIPDVTLGAGVFVAAGAVVTKSFEEGRLMGVPAKVRA